MRWMLLLLPLTLLVGCQSYERLPLDEVAHRKEWAARSAASPEVAEFARRLAARDSSPRVYNPQDGIELAEAEVIALFFNAELRQSRLEAQVALVSARHAGTWDNPELNISAGLILESISKPWMAAAALEFTIPLSGRKGVERDLAFAQHSVAWREVLAREWQVLLSLRQAWREHAATLERARLLQAHLTDVQALKDRADELAQAGELARADARVFAIELALRRIELAECEREAIEQRIVLLGMMGLLPTAPLELKPSLAPAAPANTVTLANSPRLRLFRAAYEVAEQRLRLEIRKQYPDLRIGPGYEIDQGQSAITLGFGIPIPIINLNRQGIAEARAARLAAKAAFEGELEALTGALALASARLERVRATRRTIELQLVPLVDQQVKDARERAKLGEFDALLVLDALKSRYEAKERVLHALLQEAQAQDEITGLLGPSFAPEEEEKK